jgi:hypothetical protein
VKGGVQPGYRPPGSLEKREEAINGSNYITYRYEQEFNKKHRWPERDPCERLEISVANQDPPLAWEGNKREISSDTSQSLNK